MTRNPATSGGPLADLRVIEMGSLLAGPFCGQLLGDLGAEVIKVEAPGAGDPMRQWGQEKVHGKSLWWPVIARNKKSVTVNLRVAEGQKLIRALARRADFVLENFRPGTMEKWKLGYEELSKVNKGLIMIRVSGYGQTGPYSSRAGFGSIGEAMGGLRYVCGDPDSAPSRVGISIGDSLAATFATIGALAALHHRERTGEGQVVDSAIYESVLAMMESLITEYDQTGYIRERTGPILPNVAPSNVYPTADGKMLLIAANQDTVFARLAAAMGQPELAADERYSTHAVRGQRQKELDELVSQWSKQHSAAELQKMLDVAGVPAGGIYRAPEMLEDAHFAARQAIARVMHPEFGKLAMQNVSPKLSLTPGSVHSAAPTLGQHNDQIFGELLGMDEASIAALRDSDVI
ncbi:MAG: CaiB/BaiF CoA-transferase family protein [Gammaproteobacteria bacterium]